MTTQLGNRVKYCRDCDKELILDNNWTESMKSHSNYICKECRKKWQQDNSDITNKSSKKWKDANPEKVRIINNNWKRANRVKVNISAKKSRMKRIHRARESTRVWKLDNPEKVKGYNAKHRGLGDIFLFNNPFSDNIPVVGHHISDGFEVYLPESLHLEHLHGTDTEKHRQELQLYVEGIYNISYIIERW